MKKLLILGFILATILFQDFSLYAQKSCSLTAENLKCEYRINPSGIDVLIPRLSWTLSSNILGDKQSSYRILVASSPDLLQKDIGDLWDSKTVTSDQTVLISYKGRSLLSRMKVWWKVQVWDKNGKPSSWSPLAMWSMGLLEERNWEAVWIADSNTVQNADSTKKEKAEPTGSLPGTFLRKTFSVSATIRKATAYVTALGLYEFRLNGKKVGEQLLAPEWTSYDKRASYQTYDVTDLIHQGENVAGAILGEGWYAGQLMIYGRFAYGHYPRFLAQIELELADGTHQVLVTDETWKSTTNGPIVASSIYQGEHYDARLEQLDWEMPCFNDSLWSPAKTINLDSRKLVWLRNEPIKVEKEIHPVSISEPSDGVYIFDFGQNMVGWCKISGDGISGQAIRIRYGEAVNEDGTLYSANLRGAQQTDSYTPRNTGSFEFEPQFTYHGFQYVEITGLAKPPTENSLTGRVFHSSSPFVSHFECSDSSLNKLMKNILWTQRANLMSSPNDCPQRDERFGWMGDIQAFAQTGVFNMDLGAFFTKFIQDTRDDQADDGRFPDFAPHAGDQNLNFSGTPAWGDAGVFIPWLCYVNYGDTQMLESQFRAAIRWIEYIYRNNPDLIWRNGRNKDYNDWLNGDRILYEGWPKTGGEVPRDVFATAFFARSTQIVAKMAKAINRPIEAQYYSQLADKIREAFNKNFVQPDGQITGNTQAGYALALQFDLLPEELKTKAIVYLVENIKNKYNGHLSTGIHTTHRAMLQLSNMGYNDLAWKLILERTFPSWRYMIDNGASTIWERWDGYVKDRGFQSPGMNSLNHWALGSLGEWMWRNIIGLNPDETQPGWKHFVIAPNPGGGLTWAKGNYQSIRGLISNCWKIENDKLFMEVNVPPNTNATIRIPTTNANYITKNEQIVIPDSVKDNYAEFKVESGIYNFVSEYKVPK